MDVSILFPSQDFLVEFRATSAIDGIVPGRGISGHEFVVRTGKEVTIRPQSRGLIYECHDFSP
jgi:hypothetical protein